MTFLIRSRQTRCLCLAGLLASQMCWGLLSISKADSPPAASPPAAESLFENDDAIPIEEELQTLKERRFHDLKLQLEQLTHRLTPAGESADIPEPQVDRTEAVESLTQQLESGVPTHAPVPVPDHGMPPVMASRDVQGGHAAHPVAPGALNGPVDRFALANSLFGTGEVDLCLEIIAQLDRNTMSGADRAWLEYLTANCHRKAGRLDEARKHYRRILTQQDADWIGTLARWWLTNLDERARLQTDIQNLTATMSNWEAEIAKLTTHAH